MDLRSDPQRRRPNTELDRRNSQYRDSGFAFELIEQIVAVRQMICRVDGGPRLERLLDPAQRTRRGLVVESGEQIGVVAIAVEVKDPMVTHTLAQRQFASSHRISAPVTPHRRWQAARSRVLTS
jgi:hypothetical protein